MNPFVGRLIKSSALALFVKIAGAFLSYVMFVALARAMTLEQFGYFSFSFSISVILAKVAVAGQQQVMLRDIARRSTDDTDKQERELITMRSYTTVLLISLILMIALLGYVAAQSNYAPALSWSLVVAALFIPVMAFSELQTSILRAYESVVLGLAPREIIWRVLVCILGFGIMLSLGPVLTAPVGFGLCAFFLAAATLGQSCAAPGTRFWRCAHEWSRLRDKDWLKISAQFSVSTIVTFGAPMLSVVIIGVFLSPVESGAFFAALKSSQTINLVLMATNIIASPLISRHFWKNEMVHVQLVCSYCAGAGTIFAILVFFLFAIAGHSVLGVFGEGYDTAYPELLILSVGYIFNAACGPNGAILEMTKHQHRFMRLILFSNILGVIALPVLTYFFGTIGAASAVSGTLILWNFLAAHAAIKHAHINPTIFGIWRGMALGKKEDAS
ncbi:hypothetical protein P775_02690 [Puniceibacterium antarcticum]|uniref:Uncharacterized protein n=1 Tax=Puniceibacterium antarcticum TaxID=1206336 RepID=A0A2G8RJK8_9RHOB|nr:oligosaccharide flippase family protein [Puniceibacterium antarcticum]PIL21764.1 hypothetical protein P775_02690 [Puniceibacterium antarcticum]